MARQLYFVPIIQSGPSHCSLIESKASDTNDVKWGSCGGTETSNVPGVLGDLRFDEGNANHEDSLPAVENQLK